MAQETFFVGSYTIADDWIPNAAGGGISRLTIDCETGAFGGVELVARVENPSYLAPSSDGTVLFACSELFHEDGKVHALEVESSGSLRSVSQRSSLGKATCHVSHDPARGRILATSYLDGRVVSYEATGGQLTEQPEVFDYEGHGPNTERQESSHPHQVVLADEAYFIPDLGADRIRIQSAEWAAADNAVKRRATAIETPPGYGPRHIVFHPDLPMMYVVCELEPRVLVYQQDVTDGTWALVGEHDSEVPEHAAAAAPAAIKLHPSGRTLTVSNRFSDSQQQFSVDADSGRLSAGRNVRLAGKTPRDFTFSTDGRRLIALCQDSNEAFSYPVDPATGEMGEEPTDRIEIGTPVCIISTT